MMTGLGVVWMRKSATRSQPALLTSIIEDTWGNEGAQDWRLMTSRWKYWPSFINTSIIDVVPCIVVTRYKRVRIFAMDRRHGNVHDLYDFHTVRVNITAITAKGMSMVNTEEYDFKPRWRWGRTKLEKKEWKPESKQEWTTTWMSDITKQQTPCYWQWSQRYSWKGQRENEWW